MRFFSYIRVSTKEQKDAGTFENQQNAIKNYVSANKDIEIIKEYFDGISAFKDRPAYNEMFLHLNEVDGIIIAKLSRIGRSVKQLIQIVELFKKSDKKLIVVGDNINTSTPQGMFFFHILSAVNEYEAALIKERMSEGRDRAIANGKKMGRKPLHYDVAQAIRLYNAGLGFHNIRKILNHEHLTKGFDMIKSDSTVRDCLIEAGVELRQVVFGKKKGDRFLKNVI